MTLASWLRSGRAQIRPDQPRHRKPTAVGPQLESLEDRLLLAFRFWDGGGATRNWSDRFNWVGDVAPRTGDDVVFRLTPTTGSRTTVNDVPNLRVSSVCFLNGPTPGDYVVTGAPIELVHGGMLLVEGGNETNPGNLFARIDLDIRLLGDAMVDVQGRSANNPADTSTLELRGNLSGSGNVQKIGAGWANLMGNNSYTGVTTVTQGQLVADHVSALGATTAGTTVAGNGAVLFLRGNRTFAAEPLVVHGSGRAPVLPGERFTGALASLSGANVWTGPVSLGSPSVVRGYAGSPLTLRGIVSGAAAAALTTLGTTTLSGANTYLGETLVAAESTLVVENPAALGATAAGTSLDYGAVLQLGGGLTFNAEPLTLNNSNPQAQPGSQLLASSGSVTWTGTIALAQSATLAAASGAVLRLEGALSGTAAATLTKAGAGTVEFRAASSYAGPTVVADGALIVSHPNALGATTAGTTVRASAVLQTTGITVAAEPLVLEGGLLNAAFGTSNWTGPVTLAATSRLRSEPSGGGQGTLTVSGPLSGPSASTLRIEPGRPVMLTGNNNYLGTTEVSGATLMITHANALGSAASGTVVNAGARLEVSGSITSNEPVSLSGGGPDNLGALVNQSGSNTLTGPVVLNARTLIAPATGSTLTLTGTISGGLTSEVVITGGQGTVVFAGANTYQGDTSVTSGTLAIQHAGALGAATRGTLIENATLEVRGGLALTEPLNLNGGTLRSSGGSAVWNGPISLISSSSLSTVAASSLNITSVISGAGGLTVAGSGGVFLSSANSYAGTTTINGGALVVSHSSALGTSAAGTTVNAGSRLELRGGLTLSEPLTLNGNGVAGEGALLGQSGANLWQGPVTLASSATLATVTGAGLTLAGVISGPAASSLTKIGSGGVTLAGANTYAGATVISTGILFANHAAALGASSAGTTVQDGAQLYLMGPTVFNPEPLTLNGNGIAGTGALLNSGNANTWTGAITLASSSAIGEAAGTLALTGAISGPVTSSLTKVGPGILRLSGNNAYSGATLISAGTLRSGANETFANSSDVIVAAGATLDLNSFADTIGSLAGSGNVTLGSATLTVGASNNPAAFGGVLSGTGGLTKTGTGTQLLTSANSYAGATVVMGGRLAIRHAAALGTTGASVTVLNGSCLDLQGGITLNKPLTLNGVGDGEGALASTQSGNTWTGPITLATTTAVSAVSGATITIANTLTGPGGLTKVGGGILILTGANTYGGTTALNAGTLRLGAANVIPDASRVTLAAAALLDLNNFNETVGSLAGGGSVTLGSATLTSGGNNTSTSYGGSISGTGGLNKVGTGTWALAGTNTYAGATTVSAGVLAISNAAALGATTAGTTVNAGASLELVGGFGFTFDAEPLTLNGSGANGRGAFLNVFGDNTWTGPITLASSAAVGAYYSTLTLSGPVSGLGTNSLTKLENGTVAVTGPLSNGRTVEVQEGVLALTDFTNAGTVSLTPAGLLTATNYTQTSGATMVDSGALVVTGTLDIRAGSLEVSNGATAYASAGVRNAGTISVAGFAVLFTDAILLQTAGQITLVSGVLSAAEVNVQGGILAGSGSIGGNVRNAGQLIVGGAGAAGSLYLYGNYTQTATGRLDLELGGLTPETEYDYLYIDGAATLAGELNLAMLNGYRPAVDTLFAFLTCNAGITGDFATFNGLDLGDGLALAQFSDGFNYYLLSYAY